MTHYGSAASAAVELSGGSVMTLKKSWDMTAEPTVDMAAEGTFSIDGVNFVVKKGGATWLSFGTINGVGLKAHYDSGAGGWYCTFDVIDVIPDWDEDDDLFLVGTWTFADGWED